VTAKGAISILLVDDDPSLSRVVEYQLTEAGYGVRCAARAEEALEILRERAFDLILTDLLMPGMDGMELMERLRVLHPDAVVIVITAHGDVATAVRAMQGGALDFLEKPFSRERLQVAVRRALEFGDLRDENRRLRALVQEHGNFENILGSSSALQAALSDLKLAASSDATVLILGESGTGKELAARALHLNSRRKDGPFVVVNCAAIPENLIESELFGHRRGAFTGATEDRAGKFETASGGTLFLDEVAELPLQLQPRLLRVLQEGEVDVVGASAARPVDVRVVASTHQNRARTSTTDSTSCRSGCRPSGSGAATCRCSWTTSSSGTPGATGGPRRGSSRRRSPGWSATTGPATSASSRTSWSGWWSWRGATRSPKPISRRRFAATCRATAGCGWSSRRAASPSRRWSAGSWRRHCAAPAATSRRPRASSASHGRRCSTG